MASFFLFLFLHYLVEGGHYENSIATFGILLSLILPIRGVASGNCCKIYRDELIR